MAREEGTEMTPCELVTFISTLSCAIANELPPGDTALLAAVFTQLGDSLATIAVQKGLCQEKS